VELTKTFTFEQYARGLDSWSWIDLHDLTPAFTSLFGDVFFRAHDGWWYLSTITGDLSHPWTDDAAMYAELATEDGQDEYLLGVLAMGAAARGVVLGENDVYAYAPPPMIAGFDFANIGAYDFVAALTIAGQVHEQTRRMPPGTLISGFRVDGKVVE
jgi:hypothetical protein